MEHQFKKGERVLVRNGDCDEWKFGFYFAFAEELKHKHRVFADYDSYRQCVTLEGNEDLIGTNKNPNDFLR